MNRHSKQALSLDVPDTVEDLRVVFFSDAFRHRNGVGAYYSDLTDHLASRLAEVRLVCPGETGRGLQQGLSLPLPGDRSQKLCLPGIVKAWRVVKKLRPHVIVAASPGPYGLLAIILARRFKSRFCFGYHTQYDNLAGLYWNRVFGPLAKYYLAWLDRRFFRRAEIVFTNGIHMVDAAREKGARRVKLIGTPIQPALLVPPAPLPRSAFGPVLFVGRLAPEKNLDKIIAAARALPEVPFIIAGDGPLLNVVRQAEAELPNLDYMGWIDRKNLVELLDKRCEVLVLASQIESFGTVAAEAMARERLVVVSDCCGIVDWPELAAGLRIFPTEEPLIQTLRELAEMPADQRAAMRTQARKCCSEFVQKTVLDWENTLLKAATT